MVRNIPGNRDMCLYPCNNTLTNLQNLQTISIKVGTNHAFVDQTNMLTFAPLIREFLPKICV